VQPKIEGFPQFFGKWLCSDGFLLAIALSGQYVFLTALTHMHDTGQVMAFFEV